MKVLMAVVTVATFLVREMYATQHHHGYGRFQFTVLDNFLNTSTAVESNATSRDDGFDPPIASRGLKLRGLQPWPVQITKGASTRAFGSLGNPEGSPWCGGLPTYWIVGHEKPEHPYCKQPDGQWVVDRRAELDITDSKNKNRLEELKGQTNTGIDRHDCVRLDVNMDGLEDIACFVGAGKAQGRGWNELYLTQPNGTIVKIMDHGLQKYTTLSTRVAVTLKHASGKTLIFVGNSGATRKDGNTNDNRMFINIKPTPPYFQELRGPWIKTYDAICAVVADVNGDGLDDLIVCQDEGPPFMYIQNRNGRFSEVKIPSSAGHWRNVRVGKLTGGELPDLAVVEGWYDQPASIRIYAGKKGKPYFSFTKPFYSQRLVDAAPDLELLDINNDGLTDIYVVQANERSGYCAAKAGDIQKYWVGRPWPIKKWKPPKNAPSDLLFVGSQKKSKTKGKQVSYKVVKMAFHGRGCGGMVKTFGDPQTLILSRARHKHSGYNYLLHWGLSANQKRRPNSKKKKDGASAGSCKIYTCKGKNCEVVQVEDGTPCGTGDNDCMDQNICQGGECIIGGPKDFGASCGNQTTPCYSNGTCDGFGLCQVNQLDEGTLCGLEETMCMTADICSADGECIPGLPKPLGSPCGDPLAENSTDLNNICARVWECDGAGFCNITSSQEGKICGRVETECTYADTCSEDGFCHLGDHKPAGTPCGDQSDGPCNHADACDGQGTCVSNTEPDGTMCGMPDSCTLGGKCTNGNCVWEYKPVGASCGSSSSDACDADDECDGRGNCIDLVQAADTVCREAVDTCDITEKCDGLSKSCPENSFADAGTMCGSDNRDECDSFDTCDGKGACLPNWEPEGTPCGDQNRTDCAEPDACDGRGSCLPKYKPIGTLCRAAVNECDLPEYCDGESKECPLDILEFLYVRKKCGGNKMNKKRKATLGTTRKKNMRKKRRRKRRKRMKL